MAFSPDLVVLSYDPGELRTGLAVLGIPTLLFAPPLTLDDAYSQMRALGAATGLEAEAEAMVAGITEEVARLVSTVPARREPVTYYYELDPTLYASPRRPSRGGLLALGGMENIADAAETADTAGTPSERGVPHGDRPRLHLPRRRPSAAGRRPTMVGRPGWDASRRSPAVEWWRSTTTSRSAGDPAWWSCSRRWPVQ